MTDARIPSFAVALALCSAAPLHAAAPGGAPPQVPCDARASEPPYANAGEEPALRSWTELAWKPAACLGWPEARYKFVIAIAGRIEANDAATLRQRIGAVSTLRGLRYWSVTEGAARVLIKDAGALSAPEGARRDDFTADEVRAGAVLYFDEEDNRTSERATYRMRVVEAGNERIAVETQNVSPIRSNFITLFPPGSLRSAYVLTKLDAGTWGLYAVSASTAEASNLVKLAGASYANRARAFYGHFAGKAGEPRPRD